MLRLSFVTGTQPGKWCARYRRATTHGLSEIGDDDPFALLEAGKCDLALMRLPDERVGDAHHVVVLYEEAPGVAVPKESVYVIAGGDLTYEDIESEIVNFRYAPSANIGELRDALSVVAANVGVALAPRPLLRMLSRKQVAVRGINGEPTRIALVWERRADNDAIQDFVGVAKGRTIRSSRTSPHKGESKRRS